MKNKETVWYVMPGLPGPKGQMPTLCYVAVVSEKEVILIWSLKDSHNKLSRQFSNFFKDRTPEKMSLSFLETWNIEKSNIKYNLKYGKLKKVKKLKL